VEFDTTPVAWADYFALAEEQYGDSSWRIAMNAIKNRIQVDDLIWTRDWQGNYFLGRILGEWYYDTRDECSNADIVNVRKCEWHKIGTEQAVPGKIVSCFRPARVVQRIDDDTAMRFSQIAYNAKVKSKYYDVDTLKGQDIFSLLSCDDCEDALGIYLQSKYDYLVIPSSCKMDTMNYEYELKHRETGRLAVVQVKSGGGSAINIDDYSDLDAEVFVFSNSGQYLGKPKPNIRMIMPDEIKHFLYTETHLLPSKMQVWVNLTR